MQSNVVSIFVYCSVEKMFKSKPFMDAVSQFKTILSEGVLSLSVSGATGEECRILKSLVFGNLTKSKWVECYEQIKVCSNFSWYQVTPGA